MRYCPDSVDWQVKFVNVLGEKWRCFGSGFLTPRIFIFSSQQKLSYSLPKIPQLMWQISPDTSLRKNQPDILIKIWQRSSKVWKVRPTIWPMTREPPLHWGPEKWRDFSKVTQQIREWGHIQFGIFGSKWMSFPSVLFSVLKPLTTSGETCI